MIIVDICWRKILHEKYDFLCILHYVQMNCGYLEQILSKSLQCVYKHSVHIGQIS